MLLQNFAPGTLEKFELGPEQLRALNPRLIYAMSTGYGASDGPYKNYLGMDLTLQAMSGTMSVTGEENGPPLKPPAAFPDNFDSCKTALTSASKDPASFNFEKIPENVDSCCAEYVKFLSDNRRMSGEFHGFCCNVLDWQGGAACTPWGPPTPPAFPRR